MKREERGKDIMSSSGSPAKRRKKNTDHDHGAQQQPVRGLDYFFAKQKLAAGVPLKSERDRAEKESAAGSSQGRDGAGKGADGNGVFGKESAKSVEYEGLEGLGARDAGPEGLFSAGVEGDGGTGMTDEELARKLQAEWNESDGHDGSGGMINGVNEEGIEKARAATTANGSHHLTQRATASGEQSSQGASATLGKAHAEPHGPQSSSSPPPAVRPQEDSQKSPKPAKPQTLSLQSASADEDTVTAQIPFDESPLTFDPEAYIPQLRRAWVAEGGRATYALLTRCFVLVNSTQSRIKIVDTLVNLLRTVIEGDPESLLPAVWLATNSISPPYIDMELGLGGSAISKALKKVCGLDNAALKALYNKYGDAGDVAFEAKKRQSFTLRKPKPLTIKSAFESLVKIANSKGSGSQEAKQRIVERLLQDARGAEESRYIVRTLVQHLRIGAVKTTMLIALSRAFLLSRPPDATFPIKSQAELAGLKKEQLTEVYSRGEELVKACFARRPNYNDLVPALLEIGVSDELLVRCGLALHIPLRPMLGSITRDLGEMLTKLQGRGFSCEYKYDGQRAQVHCDQRGKVTIFSRHLEVMTDKYPDLVALVPEIRGEGVGSFIMEGEVVAIDKESGELKAFQTLSNRARKDVVIGSVTIDVCLFAFDLMYLNGQELLDRSFRERRELLRSLFTEIPNHFTWVKSIDATSADADIVQEFLKSATENKCEGIMVKVLDNLNDAALEDSNIEEDPVAPTAAASPAKSRRASTKTRKKPANSNGAEDAKQGEVERDKEPSKGGRRKALLATYEPDKRLDSWLKVKKDYHTAADTLDLIPIAGWHGQGRKAKWWSPILLAVRNPDTGSLEAVTKCISGFTDKFYAANRARYDPDTGGGGGGGEGGGDTSTTTNVLPRKPAYVEYSGPEPDVWFEPQEVWECVFADITLSPTYTAAIGLVSEERGLSLRFPRFLRTREDKSIEEASSAEFLAELWRKQEARGPPAAAAADGKGDAAAAEAEDEMDEGE